MKKTLIALAAVAVSSAAMAQVTLSGKLRFAYEATDATARNDTETKTNGVRVTDGDFVLTAVEDLGGGLKASATMAVLSRGRDTGITGRDASVSLMGGFGTLTVGAVEAGNGIIGLGGAGAPVYGLDSFGFSCDGIKDIVTLQKAAAPTPAQITAANNSNVAACGVIDGGTNVNLLRYTSPKFSDVTVSVSLIDGINAGGMEKTAKTADAVVFGLNYAKGPLAAAFDVTSQDENAVPAADLPYTMKSRTRLSASYDLGVAKLGFGYQTRKSFEVDPETNKQMLIGVSVPMGAVTVGANYATHKEGDTEGTGFDLGAKYDLSKRTYLAFHLQNVKYDVDGDSFGKLNKYRVQLAHSF